MADSRQLFDKALRYIPGGVNSPVRAFRAVGGTPFFAAQARGARLTTVEGRELVDYVGTWGPAILGHAPEEVITAVCEAARKGTSFGVPNPYEVEIAEKICTWVPSVEKVRMCNSGTEATMSCLRLARGFTGRTKILKFEGCYHGHADALLVKAGSGALTLGQPDSAGVPEGVARETLTLPLNDLEAVDRVFATWGQDLAAVILEPLPANAGLIPPRPGFLEHLRKKTSEQGTVLIFDEVMTGFRLGKAGAQGIFGVTPDLSAFGKVIGGGLPVGAFGGKAAIMDFLAPLGPVYQAGTLSGNPVAMAAGLAQLKALEQNDAFGRLEQCGAELEKGIRGLLLRKGLDWTFYRYGSMCCLFFTPHAVHTLEDAKTSDTAAFASFFHKMLDAGVYLPPSQFETWFLSLAHGPGELETTLKAMEQAL